MMKVILPIIMVNLLLSTAVYSQCAVYGSVSNGAWSAYYNGDDENFTMSELEEKAAYECRMSNSGYDCEKILSSNSSGWWAITTGTDQDGYVVMGLANGLESEKEAINSSQKTYIKEGGSIGRGYYETTAWYVR